jgi:hypothetical protein
MLYVMAYQFLPTKLPTRRAKVQHGYESRNVSQYPRDWRTRGVYPGMTSPLRRRGGPRTSLHERYFLRAKKSFHEAYFSKNHGRMPSWNGGDTHSICGAHTLIVSRLLTIYWCRERHTPPTCCIHAVVISRLDLCIRVALAHSIE